MLKTENIDYEVVGSGSTNIILLNGEEQFEELFSEEPIDDFRIIVIKQKKMNSMRRNFIDRNINKYTKLLKELIEKVCFKDPIIIAHNFAYEVALNYTFINEQAKVINDKEQSKEKINVKKRK